MTKIPLEIIKLEDNSYHLLINVIINNTIKGKLVLDTGASRTVLDSKLAFEIDVSSDLPYTSGIGGEVQISFSTIEKLTLETFNINNPTVAIIDLTQVNDAYGKVSEEKILGLLGSDILLKYNAIINYKESSLCLE